MLSTVVDESKSIIDMGQSFISYAKEYKNFDLNIPFIALERLKSELAIQEYFKNAPSQVKERHFEILANMKCKNKNIQISQP